MTAIQEIDVQKVKEMADADSATIVDIRDPASFQSGHIPNAVHLSNDNIKKFISDTNKGNPLVVYCYHGISSQGAAAYFSEQGFKEVTSMTGGFESWQYTFPDLVIKA
jgi:thiosulfate sulfurtransferase